MIHFNENNLNQVLHHVISQIYWHYLVAELNLNARGTMLTRLPLNYFPDQGSLTCNYRKIFLFNKAYSDFHSIALDVNWISVEN